VARAETCKLRQLAAARTAQGTQEDGVNAAASDVPPTTLPAHDGVEARVVRGWRSSLALVVTAQLVALATTGLLTYLGPFSAAAQLTMLVHVGVGVACLAPYVVFQVAHLRAWGGQRMTSVMALGYALLVAVVTALASGVVLTYDALIGPRTRDMWSVVHLVSGLSAAGLLVVHLGVALTRRRALAARQPELRRATRRVLGTICSTALGLLLAHTLVPTVGSGRRR
jgi:hypothetical protein